jgi:hypothetical protein
MKTADIFICQRCALPIRNKNSAKSGNTSFTCPNCDVCQTDQLSGKIEHLEKILHDMLVEVVKSIYRNNHGGNEPSDRFLHRLDRELQKRNPAEDTIDEIREGISSNNPEEKLRNIVRSERMLSEFFFRSRERRYIAHSPTILGNWASLRIKLMRQLKGLKEPEDQENVLKDIEEGRYDLHLERLSKLIGDNPVPINRDPLYYKKRQVSPNETRADHLRKHVEELIKQTAGMEPSIENDELDGILRFAGNACFITDPHEVIEFREYDTRHLCKYLLQDHILIVVNDLRCLEQPASQGGGRALPELVSIHPRKPAAGNVILHLAAGRYLPNCLDVDELEVLWSRVEQEMGT